MFTLYILVYILYTETVADIGIYIFVEYQYSSILFCYVYINFLKSTSLQLQKAWKWQMEAGQIFATWTETTSEYLLFVAMFGNHLLTVKSLDGKCANNFWCYIFNMDFSS